MELEPRLLPALGRFAFKREPKVVAAPQPGCLPLYLWIPRHRRLGSGQLDARSRAVLF